jgi:hypothetical protein
MLHKDGAVADLEVAILVDHRLSLGLAGYVFSRTPDGPRAFDGTPRQYGAGYGGVMLRYAALGSSPVYASIGMLIAGGVVSLHPQNGYYYSDQNSSDNCCYQQYNENEGFFVFQPDISLHANVTRWLRFTLTGGYRIATGATRFGYDAKSLGGGLLGGSIDLGWF